MLSWFAYDVYYVSMAVDTMITSSSDGPMVFRLRRLSSPSFSPSALASLMKMSDPSTAP